MWVSLHTQMTRPYLHSLCLHVLFTMHVAVFSFSLLVHLALKCLSGIGQSVPAQGLMGKNPTALWDTCGVRGHAPAAQVGGKRQVDSTLALAAPAGPAGPVVGASVQSGRWGKWGGQGSRVRATSVLHGHNF